MRQVILPYSIPVNSACTQCVPVAVFATHGKNVNSKGFRDLVRTRVSYNIHFCLFLPLLWKSCEGSFLPQFLLVCWYRMHHASESTSAVIIVASFAWHVDEESVHLRVWFLLLQT